MHVVFAHDKPLPVGTYGGTERIIYWLMRALVKKGHRVTLIGHPSSRVKEFGIELIAGNAQNWPDLIPSDADLVHLFFPWHRELCKPYICRIGGNGKPGEVFPINTIFISKSHAQNHSAQCVVYNGLDLDDYPVSLLEGKKDFTDWKRFAFVAKASWKVKNLRDCRRAVKAAGKELHVGGGRVWTLDRKVHSYGMVNQQQKFEIFSKTDALLWPIRWSEPFGIAMIEAMAAGLPIIASHHGSSSEIVTAEVGHVCQNYAEFAEVIASAPRTFRPRMIRDYVEANFSSQRMANDYVKCYETVLSGGTLNAVAPRARFTEDAQTLLDF